MDDAHNGADAGRRAVLRGAVIGAAGIFAGAAAAAPDAHAADGDPVLLGADNVSTTATGITGGGLYASTEGDHNNALEGNYSNLSGTPDQFSGNGVYGISYNPAGDGVYGTHNNDGNGVHGEGYSDVASGVYGENHNRGFGVAGRAPEGTGVLADSANGIALDVHGLSRFSRCGTAVVQGSKAQPRAAVTVTGFYLNGFGLDLVLATPQTYVAGVWVTAAVPNVIKQRVTIHLNKAVTVLYRIAFMIIQAPQ